MKGIPIRIHGFAKAKMCFIILLTLYGVPVLAYKSDDIRNNVPSAWLNHATETIMRMEYSFSTIDGSTWSAPNRAHNFRSQITKRGIVIGPRAGSVGINGNTWILEFAFMAYGRKGCLRRTGFSCCTADKNRVELDRGQVIEWYTNSAAGIEQGFTISGRPGGSSESVPVILQIKYDGNLKPEIFKNCQEIVFSDSSGVDIIHYNGLHVYDSIDKELDAWLLVSSGYLEILIDDIDAVYPIHIDPLIVSPVWSAEGDQPGARFGWSVATAGDVNGDGYSDIIIGAIEYDHHEFNEGCAFVYYGSASGLPSSPSWTAESNQINAYFGCSVATAGDVNGDGYSDVIIGAKEYDNGELNEGRAYVYHGSASGLASMPAWTAESDQGDSHYGCSVATAGDVNGDGYSDVIVGAEWYDNGELSEGGAFVYHGSALGLAVSPAWEEESNQTGANFGCSVASAGDVNSDGYSDIIVGARGYENGEKAEGGAFVYHGSNSGLSVSTAWSGESNQGDAYFGDSVATAGDVNGDGYSDIVIGAYAYSNGETNEGRAYLYLGSASGVMASPSWITESDQVSSCFGKSVATAGDVNGDGYSDVVIGAYLYGNGEFCEGRAYLYQGSALGLPTLASWIAEINKVDALLGWSVATSGDVNGDGYSDIIVGAYGYENGEAIEGAAFVYEGSATGLSESSAWTADSNQTDALFGCSVSCAGDVNGDGYSDIVIGASSYDCGEPDEGCVFVYHGSALGLPASPTWSIESNQAYAYLGCSVATAGDVNGDGYSDIVIGADGYDNGETDEGRAFVYGGSVLGLSVLPVWITESNQAYAYLGCSVATAGDVNGDGYSDIVIGAYGYDNGETDEGRSYLYYGSAIGLPGSPTWNAEGNQADAHFGCSVANAGDVNGDGYSDIVIGADGYDNGETDEGRAFVYHGSAYGLSGKPTWTAESDQVDAQFGCAVASAGDVNADGYSDVIIGALEYDNGEMDEGRAYVYHGSISGLSAFSVWTAESNQVDAGFGCSVATAGDVNGDIYSDVIVGAFKYDNSETDEGCVLAYYGSVLGLSASPAWTAKSNQAGAGFGCSVANAGDVNGDGYSDVIIGAFKYDNGATDEGRGFLYYGNDVDGLDRIPGQQRFDDSAPIHVRGISDNPIAFRLKALGRTPLGRGNVWLEWEIKPLGSGFTGVPLYKGTVWNTGAPIPGTGCAVKLNEVHSCSPETVYHWRLRIASANPFFPRSPWFSLPYNNITETDLRTGIYNTPTVTATPVFSSTNSPTPINTETPTRTYTMTYTDYPTRTHSPTHTANLTYTSAIPVDPENLCVFLLLFFTMIMVNVTRLLTENPLLK